MSPRIRRTVVLGTAVLAGIAPVSLSPSGRPGVAAACADGTCCHEAKSLCIINERLVKDAYWNGVGPCPSGDPTQPMPSP